MGGVIVERFLYDGNITRTARDVMMHRDTVRAVLQRHFGTMDSARSAFVTREIRRFMQEYKASTAAPSQPPAR